MNENANAIITLCSHLCVGEGVIPLEPREWSELAQTLMEAKKQPKDLFDFSERDFQTVLGIANPERLLRLIDRSASLSFELEKYRSMGIEVITRADAGYPQQLKKKLGKSCPPLFYYGGSLSLLDQKTIGFVGSRTFEVADVDFTKAAVHKIVSLGYGVVSGGAKGVDTIAGTEAILCGSFAIEYLSDSMMRKLKSSETIRRIQSEKLLLLSVAKPDAGFHVGVAMMRNRFIYAQSDATIVVRSDLNKGGTWTGATENLKNLWCPTLCWDHIYAGNQALIHSGATPISADWNGSLPAVQSLTPQEEYTQVSFFE